ncbi:MAG: FkbM family methyltransferase, partial [Thermodesulfobacteriota bacterium]
MVNKLDLKILLRSGSYKFMRNLHAEEKEEIFIYKNHPIHYRAGSSDMHLIYKILLKSGIKAEYWLPDELEPRTILDIGANIGISSVYFANRYPEAKIFSFEPVPSNYALLEKNIKNYDQISAFNVALGAESGDVEIFTSDFKDNYG